MNKMFSRFVFAFLIVILSAGCSLAALAEFNEGEVLVVLKAPAGAFSAMSDSSYAMALESQVESFAHMKSMSVVHSYAALSQSSGLSIAFLRDAGKTTAQLIEELRDDPEVLSASPNYKRTLCDDPMQTYALTNDAQINRQYGLSRINIFETWDNYAKLREVVYVAVLDTGVDYNHADLRDNIAKDSNGRVIGKSFYGNGSFENNDPMDTQGHGTHIAGIIGAVGNNRIGIAGVHNQNIKIIPVNLGTGDGPRDGMWDADIIKGLNYVKELKRNGLNIRVANMSFGGFSSSAEEKTSALQVALQELSDAGVIMTISAGNDYMNLAQASTSESGDILPFPASFHMIANKITVGSISPIDGEKSDFSNFDSGGGATDFNPLGVRLVDMTAPGEYILSTVPGNKYEYYGGTSVSAPFVAGAAALLCSFFPERSATEIKDAILNNTFSGRGEGEYWTHGALNVGKAYLEFDSNPVTPIIPEPSIEEQRPIALEITIHGNTIVDSTIPVSVFPDPPGVWSTKPYERAHVELMGDDFVIVNKSIGEVELIYTYEGFNKNVVSARKVFHVLDIYHQGAAGCSADTFSLLMAPLAFFIYMASKKKRK
ncbi:MAG: S8 family serine peptidase [Synergistaceae bacterium]|nr:S8 family serine peptidase [Synergistaceae bacterium]